MRRFHPGEVAFLVLWHRQQVLLRTGTTGQHYRIEQGRQWLRHQYLHVWVSGLPEGGQGYRPGTILPLPPETGRHQGLLGQPPVEYQCSLRDESGHEWSQVDDVGHRGGQQHSEYGAQSAGLPGQPPPR